MNDDADDVRDDARTVRPHAGESVIDTRNRIGYVVAAVGLVVLVLCLVAAGYGFEGWAWIAGIAGPVLLLLGAALVLAEHRRVRTDQHGPRE